MKKLFAGLLVGTMVMAGTSTVFAATEGQKSSLTTKIIELAKVGDSKDLSMMKIERTETIRLEESSEGLMMAASVEAVELTPQQKAEMEKEQKAFEAKLKEVCEEAGYDYETIIAKLQDGTLTDEELKVFNEAGVMLAVAAQPAEMIQIEYTQEITPITKIVEKQ